MKKCYLFLLFFVSSTFNPMPDNSEFIQNTQQVHPIYPLPVHLLMTAFFHYGVKPTIEKGWSPQSIHFFKKIKPILGAVQQAQYCALAFLYNEKDAWYDIIMKQLCLFAIIMMTWDVMGSIIHSCPHKIFKKIAPTFGIDPHFFSLHDYNFLSACKTDDTEWALAIVHHCKNRPSELNTYLNDKDIYGYTPLMHACKNNNLIITQAIIDHKKNLNIKIKNDNDSDMQEDALSVACTYSPRIAFVLMPEYQEHNFFYKAFTQEKNPTVALELCTMPDYNESLYPDNAARLRNFLFNFFNTILMKYDIYRKNPSHIHPQIRAAIFSIAMCKQRLKNHPFNTLSKNALREPDIINHYYHIDQRDLLRIALYKAYNEWIANPDSTLLSDFFTSLPARMVLNMKIIQKMILDESDENYFSKALCKLYKEWFEPDENTQKLDLILEKKEAFVETLEHIHFCMFEKMLQHQIDLHEQAEEEKMLDGSQLHALSNAHFCSTEHLAAVLGMLISLEKNTHTKHTLCRQLSMFTHILLEDYFTSPNMPLAIHHSHKKRSIIYEGLMINIYIAIQSGFLNSIIGNNLEIRNTFELAQHVLCNHEPAILKYIAITDPDSFADYDEQTEEDIITFHSKLFRYGTKNPKYIALWNKKFWGKGSIDEYTGKLA